MKLLVLYLLIWCYKRCPRRNLIEEDIDHWKEVLGLNGDYFSVIRTLMRQKPEFRNLIYYRIGNVRILASLFKWCYPPLSTLYLWSENIGGGLFIQHGFSTVIAAHNLGRHCHVNQQVTIGYKGDVAPSIGNNVTITCGAKVLGGVSIGDNCIIGANAVVVKNVPDNSTVVGIPAHIIKKNGVRIDEKL